MPQHASPSLGEVCFCVPDAVAGQEFGVMPPDRGAGWQACMNTYKGWPDMFSYECDVMDSGRVRKLCISGEEGRMNYARVINAWITDAAFSLFFSDMLASMPYTAFFWEVRPVSRAVVEYPFECVLMESPQLAGVLADATTFAGNFGKHTGPVSRFSNLSGDAMLVVPTPLDANTDYAHLASFVRSASESQQCAFWRGVGEAVRESLSGRTLWLSTSGLGVYWLHARLDTRPKYYTYQPYTAAVPETA